MYWRDKVILAVAEKMYTRWNKSRSWGELDEPFKDYWAQKASETIEDVCDGAKEAGWSIEFVGKGGVSY